VLFRIGLDPDGVERRQDEVEGQRLRDDAAAGRLVAELRNCIGDGRYQDDLGSLGELIDDVEYREAAGVLGRLRARVQETA
jgi:hypothetical protein